MVGGILGREAFWSLVNTALEDKGDEVGVYLGSTPNVPANPLPDFSGMFATKTLEDFPVTSFLERSQTF